MDISFGDEPKEQIYVRCNVLDVTITGDESKRCWKLNRNGSHFANLNKSFRDILIILSPIL